MQRTIVVAVTDRATAAPAVDLGIALARPAGARLVLGAVAHHHGISRASAHEPPRALVEACRSLADAVPHDVPAEVDTITSTSMARAFHDLATRHDAQLLVIAHEDRGALARALEGDRSAEAVFTAPCGVAVATGMAPSLPRRIGVAWDRSPETAEALEWAVQLAERTGGSIELLHFLDSVKGEALERDAIEAELERLRVAIQPRADAVTMVAWGDPARLFAQLGQNLDLLVLGSRRLGPVRRAFAGSMSALALHHAPCAVVVLPRGVHVPADAAAV